MFLRILKTFVVGFILFIFFVMLMGKKLDETQIPQKADIIVSLGGGYAERLDEAILLYKKNFANKILFTGSLMGTVNRHDKIGYWKVKYFESHGVAKKHLYFLKNTPNTHAEVEMIQKYMFQHQYKSVLIVSDPPHSKRIRYLINLFKYKEQGLTAKVIGSHVSWWNKKVYCDSPRAIWEALKELIGVVYYEVRYTLLNFKVEKFS